LLNINLTPKGQWEDMASWLYLPEDQTSTQTGLNHWHLTSHPGEFDIRQSPFILYNPRNGSWGTLYVACFNSRPAHADQLHFDLWWRGINLAQDPGTYLYNSTPPWENSLTSAFVHNTVVIDGQEPMSRAGRFLYLDWAQARVLSYHTDPEHSCESLIAEHNGYRKIGITHSREVTLHVDGHWEIIDHLDGPAGQVHTARLHWLLPDWQYEVLEPSNNTGALAYEIRIRSPYGWVILKTGSSTYPAGDQALPAMNLYLARAGKLVYGFGEVSLVTGWTSPTYGDKIAALACILEISQPLPIELKSEWILPSES
jgi:hypothetical protein